MATNSNSTTMEVSPSSKQALRQLSPGVNDDQRLNNLTAQVRASAVSSQRTKVVVIKAEDVSPGTRLRLRETSPVDGDLTSLAVTFPDGANNLVDISVEVQQEEIVPGSGSFLSLNDLAPVLPVSKRVKTGDRIDLTVRNKDSVHSHTIHLLAVIEQNPAFEQLRQQVG